MTARVPRGEPKRRQMNVHATVDLVQRVEAFQRTLGITRSSAMCILIESGLQHAALSIKEE